MLPLGIAMTLAATPYCRKDKKDQNPQQSSKPGDPPSTWDGISDWPESALEVVDE
jgi:hypothetical protein